jgi:hypothetical protein
MMIAAMPTFDPLFGIILLIAVSLIWLSTIVAGLFVWRKEKGWVIWSCLAPAAISVLNYVIFQGGPRASLMHTFIPSWATGVACFSLMRSRKLGFTHNASCAGALVGSILYFALIFVVGYWPFSRVLMALCAVALVVGVAWGVRFYAACAATDTAGVDGADSSTQEEDRRMVLSLVQEGKVSGEQATELIKALGSSQKSASAQAPLAVSVMGAVAGTILVVIGFMLPWAYIKNLGGLGSAYQAGYHVGFVGWAILATGILPALLVCIPALDKHVRQALLRIVTAGIGVAFLVAMVVRSPDGIGLWVAGAGFGLHLATGILQTRFEGLPER